MSCIYFKSSVVKNKTRYEVSNHERSEWLNRDKIMIIETDKMMRLVKDLERINELEFDKLDKYLRDFYSQRKQEIQDAIEQHLLTNETR